jgi:hypothetical protein
LLITVKDYPKASVISSPVENTQIEIYKTTILLMVLHACETWSLTSTEEHILRVKDAAFRETVKLYGSFKY